MVNQTIATSIVSGVKDDDVDPYFYFYTFITDHTSFKFSTYHVYNFGTNILNFGTLSICMHNYSFVNWKLRGLIESMMDLCPAIYKLFPK